MDLDAYLDAHSHKHAELSAPSAPSPNSVTAQPEIPAPPASAPPAPAPAYPLKGKLASALADHFGQGFDANFIDAVPDESPAWLRDGLVAGRNSPVGEDPTSVDDDYADELDEAGSPFGDGFDRRLAQQFTGEDEFDDDGLNDFEEEASRPLGRRSLQWIRRNMSSLRIIVSLQRVVPPEPFDDRPRKITGH